MPPTKGMPYSYTYEAGEAITASRPCYLKSDGKMYMTDDTTKPPMFCPVSDIASAAKGVFESPFPSVTMKAGGAINPGQTVISGTDGVCATTDTDNAWCMGFYIGTAACALNQEIEVLYAPHVTNDKSALQAD